jgi:DNA-directed RNA polymerase subunit RPC12/RpoP
MLTDDDGSRCRRCGYLLAGLDGLRCPECGVEDPTEGTAGEHTIGDSIVFACVACGLSVLAIWVLNDLTWEGILSGALFQGLAVGCTLRSRKLAPHGGRLVAFCAIGFVSVILVFVLVAGASLWIRD